MSGRLNKDRIREVVEIFTPTVAEEKQAKEEAERLAKEAEQIAEQTLRMEAVKAGPMTLSERLAKDREAQEIAELRYERLLREKRDLENQLSRMKQSITQAHEELTEKQEQFDAMVKRQKELREDEDFEQAVALLEQQKPDQAKAVLQQLIAEGDMPMAVEYLAAMQQRKAAKVLSAFDQGNEVITATRLIESLRLRGIEPMVSAPSTM